MAPVKNGRVLFNEVPTGYPVPGKTTIYDDSERIDLENVALDGGVLLQILVLSIDPYLRNRMRDPKIESFMPAFEIGSPIMNFAVARVLRSEDPSLHAGDYISAALPFQHYVVSLVKDLMLMINLGRKSQIPWSAHIGVAGMPGATAYMGWKEYANAKAGQTVFVTTGAGCVGATVIQIAKSEGLKVIASAGSDEKVQYMKSIGADVVFNYKTTKSASVLEKEGPIDIYWDNTGGEALDAALANCKRHARFVECGMISTYNHGDTYQMKNLNKMYQFEITLYGYIVTTLMPKYPEFYVNFPHRIAKGEIKYREDIVKGLENTGQAILSVQKGTNTGKSIVAVAE